MIGRLFWRLVWFISSPAWLLIPAGLQGLDQLHHYGHIYPWAIADHYVGGAIGLAIVQMLATNRLPLKQPRLRRQPKAKPYQTPRVGMALQKAPSSASPTQADMISRLSPELQRLLVTPVSEAAE